MVQKYTIADHLGATSTPSFYHSLGGTNPHEDGNSYSDFNSSKNQPLILRLEKTIGDDSSLERAKHILLVDDDDDSCLSIKACLETYFKKDVGLSGFAVQVTTFVDPTQALSEFKPYYYDLLLVDINMPGVNGYELVE